MATAPRKPARKNRTPSAPTGDSSHGTALLERSDVRTILLDLAQQLAPADVASLMAHEQVLRTTANHLPSPRLALLRDQLQMALDCLRDHVSGRCPQIPLFTISLLAAAVSYFGCANDVIPDFLPRIGRLDDAAVMALAFHLGQDGIRRYCAATGRTAEVVFVADQG